MSGRAIYTPEQKQQALELRRQGLAFSKIAELVGMKPESVASHCIQAGVVPPTVLKSGHAGEPYRRVGKTVRPFTADEDTVIRQMRSEGEKPPRIAERLQRHVGSIYNRLRTLDFNDAKEATVDTNDVSVDTKSTWHRHRDH